MKSNKDILVYAHWVGFSEPVLMGILSAVLVKGKEVFSFEYDKIWLQSGATHIIDPDLQFYTGRYYPLAGRMNFGMILDSGPDRWGRVLMERGEMALARNEKRTPEKFYESDFLLGVYDGYRMGGLRFKLEKSGPFLKSEKTGSIPPMTTLRELEYASRIFEEDNTNDEEYLKWISLLIAPGSSLGGARPKAGVLDPGGHLWIAKFPSIKDRKNTGAWEMVVHQLAVKSGLNVPESKIGRFNSEYHTFITKRFDRNKKGERIHFASAMTMLGYSDGDGHDSGASYLEVAEFLLRNGAEPQIDLNELWTRIVFSICVKNTDDHLRNHGFLLTDKGWRLSPAFDLNPNEYGAGLCLNISENENSLDPDLALSVSGYFRLDENKAAGIITRVKEAVSGWRKVAKQLGLSASEQEMMRGAFELE